ncbi:MAG TPA: electron transfer flavoprotein subunit alpha/FixB family protein [Polyangia bacterium]
MGAVAVFVEITKEGLRSTSLPAITAARDLAKHHGGPVIGVALGGGPELASGAAEAAKYLDKVVTYQAPELATMLAESYAPVLANAVKTLGATALVASATSTGKDVLPRTAALLGAGMASEITAVNSGKSFRRPTYAGNALAEVEVTTPIVVASVRQTDFAAATPSGSAGAVEAGTPGPIDSKGAQFVGIHVTKSARPDLTEAKVVVSGGRGMKAGENFKVLEELTDLLGGALGASRAACDAGMVPNDLQVGQTGKVVAPALYIAVAISGAIQHLAGMKGSKTIVAINKDPEAPIFQVADYGLIGNWETTIPALIAEVKKATGRG